MEVILTGEDVRNIEAALDAGTLNPKARARAKAALRGNRKAQREFAGFRCGA